MAEMPWEPSGHRAGRRSRLAAQCECRLLRLVLLLLSAASIRRSGTQGGAQIHASDYSSQRGRHGRRAADLRDAREQVASGVIAPVCQSLRGCGLGSGRFYKERI